MGKDIIRLKNKCMFCWCMPALPNAPSWSRIKCALSRHLKKSLALGHIWWHAPVIPALRSLKQDYQVFKGSLVYTARLCLIFFFLEKDWTLIQIYVIIASNKRGLNKKKKKEKQNWPLQRSGEGLQESVFVFRRIVSYLDTMSRLGDQFYTK